jgi:hypothetical protein
MTSTEESRPPDTKKAPVVVQPTSTGDQRTGSYKRNANTLSPLNDPRVCKASKNDINGLLIDKIAGIIDFVNQIMIKVDSLDKRLKKLENNATKNELSWANKVTVNLPNTADSSGSQATTSGYKESFSARPLASVISNIVDVAEKKRRSLIMFEVDESPSNDIKSKIEQDRILAERVLAYLGVSAQSINSIYRFKNKTGTTRGAPVRLILNNAVDRDNLLKRAYTLKESEHNKIYLKPDLTEAELVRERELIAERNARNKDLLDKGKFEAKYIIKDLSLRKVKLSEEQAEARSKMPTVIMANKLSKSQFSLSVIKGLTPEDSTKSSKKQSTSKQESKQRLQQLNQQKHGQEQQLNKQSQSRQQPCQHHRRSSRLESRTEASSSDASTSRNTSTERSALAQKKLGRKTDIDKLKGQLEIAYGEINELKKLAESNGNSQLSSGDKTLLLPMNPPTNGFSLLSSKGTFSFSQTLPSSQQPSNSQSVSDDKLSTSSYGHPSQSPARSEQVSGEASASMDTNDAANT